MNVRMTLFSVTVIFIFDYTPARVCISSPCTLALDSTIIPFCAVAGALLLTIISGNGCDCGMSVFFVAVKRKVLIITSLHRDVEIFQSIHKKTLTFIAKVQSLRAWRLKPLFTKVLHKLLFIYFRISLLCFKRDLIITRCFGIFAFLNEKLSAFRKCENKGPAPHSLK